MRFIRPDLRLRTIVTYQRPEDDQIPASVVSLVGFVRYGTQAALNPLSIAQSIHCDRHNRQ
ncbi:hypothetical protein [Leptolyngbya sp. FACHB-711]|uniref:hypothetical protein n=1 Tax=unclassified Leptolyngbya TaxID=2650499 RepID=UPI001F558A4F|nr:hypothetical protein [Leptolyngbya sp. FACHB-711]